MAIRRDQIDAAWLKERYLFGVPLTDDRGNTIPDTTLDYYLRRAVRELESHLEIHIERQEAVEERKDFRVDEWRQWSFLQLRRRPVRAVKSVDVMFGDTRVFNVPAEWIRIAPPANRYGQIQLFPTLGTFASVPALDQAYVLAPILLSNRYAPQVFKVVYDTGMDELDEDLTDAIGMIATVAVLTVLGESVFGAGVASVSIGMDGLSQSIGTTRSSENTTYGARIATYKRELWGWTVEQPGLMAALKKKWFMPTVTAMT